MVTFRQLSEFSEPFRENQAFFASMATMPIARSTASALLRLPRAGALCALLGVSLLLWLGLFVIAREALAYA